MLNCGARLSRSRVLPFWGHRLAAWKSSHQATAKTPTPAYPLLRLDDGKVFRLKTNWELLRGLLIFFLCSSPWLVQKAPLLLSASRRILGRRLWSSVLRLTLYGQFAAGETQKEIKETLQWLQGLGIRPLLAVPTEEDVGQAKDGEVWYDRNTNAMLSCLDLSLYGTTNPMMQLKMTALMSADLCKTITLCLETQEGRSDLSVERAAAVMKGEQLNFSCLNQEENHHFQKSLHRLNFVAQYAVEKKVRILVDAEYTYLNPAMTLVTLAMMVVWNVERPWIWNTYQAYLKNTLDRLNHDLALINYLGICFGVKLVRGAYLEQERKLAKEKGYADPVQPSWEATNESYHRCLDFVLDQASQAQGKFELIVATHNEASVTHAMQRMAEMGVDKSTGPVCFGQLLGMCDQISLALGQAGYAIYKSIPYGSVEEVIPYLIRRANENHSILRGIRKERDLLRSELRRRILRKA